MNKCIRTYCKRYREREPDLRYVDAGMCPTLAVTTSAINGTRYGTYHDARTCIYQTCLISHAP